MAKGIAAKLIAQRMHQSGGKGKPPRIAAEGSKGYTGKLPGERKRQREREAETGVSA